MGSIPNPNEAPDASPSPFLNKDVPIKTGRPLKVIQIGAGITGIQMCHKIQNLRDLDFKIYEKNSGLGGTWFENTYPGCACDVPAHAYQYTWEPNPTWSRLIVGSQEILKYLQGIASKHGFLKYMNFEHKVVGATWSEVDAKWTVEVERQTANGPEAFSETCDILISGTGVLNVWKYPKIDGMENYKGKMMHTAKWDHSFDMTGKKIAVLGSGASAIQVTPELQKTVKQMDVYIRSPTWLMPDPWKQIHPEGALKVYTKEETDAFAADPALFLKYRKQIESRINGAWPMFYKNSPMQNMLKGMILEGLKNSIKDEALRKFMIPTFDIGCRRPTSGDGFVKVLQEPNVTPILEGVNEMNEEGIVDKNGVSHAYDAVVCATGFDTSFTPRFPVRGRREHELRKDFSKSPEAYLGLVIHGYPNYFMFAGPISPVGNGSAYPGAEITSEYISRWITRIQRDGIRTFEVKEKPQVDFNAWVQSTMPKMVWTGGCNSWYKNPETGKVQVTWPGSMLHYSETMKEVHYEHFEIDYLSSNCFDWLGNGLTWAEMHDPKADLAPYIT